MRCMFRGIRGRPEPSDELALWPRVSRGVHVSSVKPLPRNEANTL